MISDPSSRNIPRNNWEHGLWNLYTKVYSSIIHRSQKVGTTQMSNSRWTDKQNVLCSQIHIQRIIFCLIFLIIKKRTLNILQHGWTLKTGVKCFTHFNSWGFPGSSTGKEYACNAGNLGSIPGLGRSPGEGNGYPLQYSCLENSMDRGAWQATSPWGHKESDTTATFTFILLMPDTEGQILHYSIYMIYLKIGKSWEQVE